MICFLSIFFASTQAHAYIGPGLGLGAIGLFFAVIGSLGLAFFAILYYPIKRFIQRRFKSKATGQETIPDDVERKSKASFKQKLSLIFLGIFSGLMLAEAVLRFVPIAPKWFHVDLDQALGEINWSDNPNLVFFPTHIADPRLSINGPKSPGTVRVVVLGDSVTRGNCNGSSNIEPEQNLSRVLERLLNEHALPNSKYEVINLGVTGYNTLQESEYLREVGLSFQPDLVIVIYSLNDALARDKKVGKGFSFVNYWDRLTPAFSRLAIISVAFRFLWTLSRGRDGLVEDWDIPKTGFRKIRAMASEKGFRTLVGIVPQFEGNGEYKRGKDHRIVGNLAKSFGFEVLDFYDSFILETTDFRTLLGRCILDHPDERGHKVMGEALFKKITSFEPHLAAK